MTTNQTIDGVSLELIQSAVCSLQDEGRWDVADRLEHEMRTLLDAKPKAEPVAYLCKGGGSKWLQYGAQVSDPWRPEEVELTPLYAEQPAPVVAEPVCIYWDAKTQNCIDVSMTAPIAMKFPERCQEKTIGKDPMRSNYAVGWDACLDEMKRLNVGTSDDRYTAVQELQSIPGVGLRMAQRLYDAGVRWVKTGSAG